MATDVNKDFIRPPLSATGRFKCPVADRGESGKRVPLLSAACKRDISHLIAKINKGGAND